MKSRQKQISRVLSKKVNSLYLNHLNNQPVVRGSIQTNGQEEGFDSCTVPSDAIAVRFTFRVNAAMAGWVICKVVAGGVPTMDTFFTSSFVSRTMDVPLKVSNTTAQISIKASDPNGAFVSWELVYPSVADERKGKSWDSIR